MSVVSGIWGAVSSKSAAGKQADAAKDAAQVQWQMYKQSRKDQLPLMKAGTWASNKLSGIGPGVGLIQKGPGEFEESPGYQWTLGQGLQAQQRAASATGRLGSGDYIKDATKYAEGLASTEYDNFLRRYYESLDPYFRMAGYGSNVAISGGNQANQTGNALANTYMAGGAAQAAGTMGAAQSGVNALRTGTTFAIDYYKNYGNPWASTAPSWGSLGGWGNTIAGSAEGANAMYWL